MAGLRRYSRNGESENRHEAKGIRCYLRRVPGELGLRRWATVHPLEQRASGTNVHKSRSAIRPAQPSQE
jgi:hypothetical protein